MLFYQPFRQLAERRSCICYREGIALSTHKTMTAIIDSLAQWDALAQREVAEGYRVKAPSATSSAASLGLHLPVTGMNATTGCPIAWREKIVEWCYQVVDHW